MRLVRSNSSGGTECKQAVASGNISGSVNPRKSWENKRAGLWSDASATEFERRDDSGWSYGDSRLSLHERKPFAERKATLKGFP